MAHIVEKNAKVTTIATGRVIQVVKYELVFDTGCVWVFGDKEAAYKELERVLKAA